MPEESKNITPYFNFDLFEVLQHFSRWSEKVLQNKESAKELVAVCEEADALYMQIRYMAVEIKFFEKQYSDTMARFVNIINTLNNSCDIARQLYGDKFSNAVPPLPISLTCESTPPEEKLH